jgi:predicted TIM-barrel fold metal-dependent hydrolase
MLTIGSVSGQTPLVDHHQHLFSPMVLALAPAAARGFAPIAAKDLVALMDSAGIRRALVLSLGYQYGNPNITVEDEYAKVKAENDWTSQQVAQFPDRLRAFCGLNPLRDYALEELARCAKDTQLRSGLKLHFGNSDVDVHNAEHIAQLRRVFRDANDRRMPIVIHMHSSVTKKRPYGAEEARIFLNEVLPAAPDVAVQIAHLAGAGSYDDSTDAALGVFADAISKKDARTRQVYFDISGMVGRELPDARAALIARRIRQLGLERVLFGSDGAVPGNSPREAWANLHKLPLSEDEFRRIANNVAPYMK